MYLAESLGLDEVADYWTQVLTVNEWQRTRFVKRVVRCLNGTLVGKKMTVLGYAFKKDTNDTRESPALEVIKLMLDDAPQEIAVFDPCCDTVVVKEEIRRLVGADVLKDNGGNVEVYADAYHACADAHAVLIMTDCDEFKNSASPSLGPQRKSPKSKLADPRPFQRLEPTELEILSLEKYLASTFQVSDPLQRYEEEPECSEACEKCANEIEKTIILKTTNERLDWSRIAYHLQKPRWVFDGRGILNVPEMEALGVRVESIGKVGWAGR